MRRCMALPSASCWHKLLFMEKALRFEGRRANDGESLQPRKMAVRLKNIMGVVKYLGGPALSLVLVVGILCAQICAFNCSFYGCSMSSPVPTSQLTNVHAHCHQHQENTAPQKRNDSPQCAGHFDAIALASSRSSVYTSTQPLSSDALIVQSSLGFNPSTERQVVQSRGKPDRSPPANSVLRI